MSSSIQLICIKRPEPDLSPIFEDMYINERLVDVTLSCCDGQLQAHKLVLAACSPYFSSLFNKLANPFHYPVVVIKDMKIDDLRLIMDFMYRGQLTLSQDRLSTLIKCAENLQITGLSTSDSVTDGGSSSRPFSFKMKKIKKQGLNPNMHTNNNNNNNNNSNNSLARSYQLRQNELDSRLSPQANKLLERSMITDDSLDDAHQFSYASHDPTSTRNLNSNQMQHSSTLAGQQLTGSLEQPNEQLSNRLQVLSHSFAANRTSLVQNMSSSSVQQAGNCSLNQLTPQNQLQQQSRGRVHPCNICWKTFREKANLKRHLQVHSIDRVVYACPDCNKTFSWKDNYIRHTKTTHHMNNVRPQT